MSKKKIFGPALVLAMALSCHAFADIPTAQEARKEAAPIGTDNGVITINDTELVQKANEEMLGIAMINVSDYYSEFLIPGTMDINETGKKLMKEIYNVPFIRFTTGGAAWNSIGPQSQRKPTTFKTPFNGLPSEETYSQLIFGIVESIKLIRENNPGIKCIITVNPDDDPEALAQLALFLTDDKSASRWGKLRAEYGVPEPVDVMFELGNERDRCTGWKFAQGQLDWYLQRARLIIDAVKAACPEMKFIACGKTAMWDDRDGTVKWTRGLAEVLGKDMDYISMHPYYSGNELPIVHDYMKLEMDTLNEVLGEDHGIKFMITEHAKWPKYGSGGADELMTLESVLCTSNFLNQEYANTMVAGANFHTFYHGPENVKYWTMITYDGGTYVKQGMLGLYELYRENVGDRVFPVEITGDSERMHPEETSGRLSVLATAKDKNVMKLIITNRSEEYKASLTFNFQNKYTLLNEQVFTAPNNRSWIYSKGATDIFTLTSTDKNESNFSSYEMPTKSVVVLTLQSDKSLPTLDGTLTDDTEAGDDIQLSSDTTFTDIDGVWASGEISKLYELGIVSDSNSSLFNPFGTITRGEFASMLTKAMGYSLDYPNVFSDVPTNSWCRPFASAMYFEGIMTGDDEGLFNQNEPITLQELISATARVARNGGKTATREISSDNFKLWNDFPQWGRADVLFAAQVGILTKLYENGNLKTTDNATRAEAASVIYRLYNLMNS